MPETTPLELSVVIPAFNESERIGGSLGAILRYLETRRLRYEVIVVDDGSEDGTAAVASDGTGPNVRVLRLSENRGKGAALKRGVGVSRGRSVLLTDADLSTPIEDLEALEPCLGRAEIVLGSRAVASSRILRHQPWYREVMGKTFNLILRLAGVIRGLRDTQCGFKLLRGAVARELFEDLVTRGFAYDVELVWLALRSGYRVEEVGVRWADAPASRVRALVDPFKMLAEIARFRWVHRHRLRDRAGRPPRQRS